jgi:hypothetical protein
MWPLAKKQLAGVCKPLIASPTAGVTAAVVEGKLMCGLCFCQWSSRRAVMNFHSAGHISKYKKVVAVGSGVFGWGLQYSSLL